MAIDLTERRLIEEHIQSLRDKENNIDSLGFSSAKMKQSEIDEEFDNLDITQYSDVK